MKTEPEQRPQPYYDFEIAKIVEWLQANGLEGHVTLEGKVTIRHKVTGKIM